MSILRAIFYQIWSKSGRSHHMLNGYKKFKETQNRIAYLTLEQQIVYWKKPKKMKIVMYIFFTVIGLETAMRRMEILPITAYLAEVLTPYLQKAEPEQIWLFPAKNPKPAIA